MRRREYDYLDFVSFPSSLRFFNNDPEKTWIGWATDPISVKSGVPITVRGWVKLKHGYAVVAVHQFKDGKWQHLDYVYGRHGTSDWIQYEKTISVPSDIFEIRVTQSTMGYGDPQNPTIIKFDDLQVWQEGKLIYENKFSNWLPYQIAGAVITVIPVGLYAARRMPKITVPQEWWK